MKPVIAEPCHENWNLMSIQDQGRHCAVCDKVVVDLTQKTDQEIAHFFEDHQDGLCTRMRTESLHGYEIPEDRWIRTAPKWQHFLLAIGLFFFMGNVLAAKKGKHKKKLKVSEFSIPDLPVNYNEKLRMGFTTMPRKEVEPELGFPFSGHKPIYPKVDEPAYFPGGQEEMQRFINSHLIYNRNPLYKGTVIVNVLVLESGKVDDPIVFQGIEGAPELEAKVLELIRQMPDWIPGRINGYKVGSVVNIEIEFNQ